MKAALFLFSALFPRVKAPAVEPPAETGLPPQNAWQSDQIIMLPLPVVAMFRPVAN